MKASIKMKAESLIRDAERLLGVIAKNAVGLPLSIRTAEGELYVADHHIRIDVKPRPDKGAEEPKRTYLEPVPNAAKCQFCINGQKRVKLTDGSLAHEFENPGRGITWCEPCIEQPKT